MRLNKDIIEDSNRKELSLHEQSFDFLSNSFIRKNVDVTNILKKISDFQVAIPSWALGAGGGLIMMNAIENGDIKVNKGTKEVVFLSVEELKRLEKYTFQIKRLEVIKDCFVFCCYTGLAFKEMVSLKKEHIVKGFDGEDWIKMKRQKTQKELSIPLLPKAKKILRKYASDDQYLLPITSNARFNGYLKEIADMVGIEKTLTHHMARRTFATTVLLYNNVPMEIVSELLGHTKLATTQQSYGKIIQKKVGEEMKRLREG